MEKVYAANKIKRCVIITGMSGGGKSSALDVFEDQGFYVIDNLPPTLMPQLLDVLAANMSAVRSGVAAVVDVRSADLLDSLETVLPVLGGKTDKLDIIFVDATDETLVRRFETTRRLHPLSGNTTILGGITRERELLSSVLEKADIVMDTSCLKPNEFRTRLLEIMDMGLDKTSVIFSSFGFKYGIPHDADYVLDVRFLPNPNYVDELHLLSGKDSEIQEYLRGFKELDDFTSKARELIDFVSSVYCANTGKKHLHIAIGCTGGRHRSVAVAEMLAEYLKKNSQNVIVNHRDINKGGLQ